MLRPPGLRLSWSFALTLFAFADAAMPACNPAAGTDDGGGGSSPSNGTGGSGIDGSGGGPGGGSGGKSGGGTGGNGMVAGSGGTSGGTGGGAAGGIGVVTSVPCDRQVDNVAPSIDPPGGLTADKVPMFVMLGFDDNAFADGINWALDNLRERKNADGTAVRSTFFISAGFDSEFFNPAGGQSEADLLAAWKKIKADDHEIANHTWSHGENLMGADTATWTAELTKANNLFTTTLGLQQCQVAGFRTPFLGFSQSTFDAVKAAGFIHYDASIEFGYDWWQAAGQPMGWSPGASLSGQHYYWPFTMDGPFLLGFYNKGVTPNPGVWEIPVYTFNKISGDMASTVTGFDYNLWTKCQSDSTFDFTSVLKNSLDQRLMGNRSPFAIGAHTDNYSQFNESANSVWTTFNYQVRRKALSDFIDYALSKPEVRMVRFIDVINWMRHPTPL
jgi:peptidoglycan/xylan/chitin deacetylase (PgdA/CDA1 family)